MSAVAERLAQSLSGSFNNMGGALLDTIRKKRAQEQQEAELALRAELGRGELGLGRDRLTADVRSGNLDRDQRFTLAGFENTASGAPGGMTFADIPESSAPTTGVQNAGGALESLLSPSGGSWKYNRALDPRAINMEDEQAHDAGESLLERQARIELQRSGNANALRIAQIGEEGADRRSNASNQTQRYIATTPTRSALGANVLPTRAAWIAEHAPGQLDPKAGFDGSFIYPRPDSVYNNLNRTYDLLSGGGASDPMAERRAEYDALVAKHGKDAVVRQIGPRP